MKDGSLVITRYFGSGANVVIPANVMSIGYRVFYGNQTIETIFLPDSIRLIGSEAFAACPRLKELRLPPFVVQIGNDIVYDNTTLFCPFNSGTAGLLIKKGIPFQGC